MAAYALVPAQVFGDVAVGLPNKRTVKIQHRDPATGAWDAPSTLYKAKGKVTCGDLEGQSSPGGVALLLECDTPYFEENAPVHSLALVSRDGRTWTGRTLDGEAYQQPAIAPSGAYAAWLVGGGGHYLLWSASTGFADADTTYGYDSGGETLVVDDAGTVSVIGPQSAGQDCVVGVHSRDLAGQRTSSVVGGIDPGCVEGQFENISALSVTGGLYGAAQRFTISRADTASPWVLTSGRPADAPGLVSYARPNRQITTSFLETSDPARPLVAVGGPDHHRVLAQVFDAAAQTWGAQTPIWSSPRRCRAGDDYSFAPRAIYVFAVRCGRKQTVLASADAATWTVGQVGRRAWTYAEGRVALPDRTGTTVVSPTGVQRYGVTTGGPCDVVYPAARAARPPARRPLAAQGPGLDGRPLHDGLADATGARPRAPVTASVRRTSTRTSPRSTSRAGRNDRFPRFVLARRARGARRLPARPVRLSRAGRTRRGRAPRRSRG